MRLSAVRTGRVYVKPRGASVYFSGIVETPLYARWLAETAHPALPAPPLRAEMARRYGQVLGGSFDDDELDHMLRVAQNRGTCGYERFARTEPASRAGPAPCDGRAPR